MKKLQAEWQAIGPVPRPDTRVTWKRFRDACDTFFTRRNDDLAQRKEIWSANLAKKEALCARAEELAASTDWEQGAVRDAPAAGRLEERRPGAPHQVRGDVAALPDGVRHVLRSLQAARRDRARNEAGGSRSARDRARIARGGRYTDAAEPNGPRSGATSRCRRGGGASPAIVAPPAPPAPDPVEHAALLEQVRSLRTRWNQSTTAVRQGADPLSGRFMSAMERVLTAYPDAFRGRARRRREPAADGEALPAVEGFLNNTAPPAGSSQALAALLREALASNTIGGRAGEESKWRAHGRRRPRRTVLVVAPRPRARGGRTAALRPLPQGLQPVLRADAPARAATGARRAQR